MGGDFTKRIVWLACLALVLSTTFALGQGIVTGSIAGTVVDPQKAVVPGAKVDARNVATNVDYKATTNDQGYFSIRSIPAGTYAVSVQAPNFKRLDVGGVVVNTGVTTDMGALALALGTTAETITVEAAAPLVDTTSAQGGANFSAATTQNVPLNGGFDQMVLFIPGVVTAGNAGIFAQQNGASFSSNGQRDRSNTFQIDGQFNNDTGVTGPAIAFTNQDAIQEVQVVTNNFGVEYGRTSGSTVNYITKSGTNNFHGTAFEYFTGDWADSLTHLEGIQQGGNGVAARFTENRWGGTLGGPIVPNKIFFFTSYQQDTAKGSSPPAVTSSLTPTPNGLTQLATCYPTGTLGSQAVNILNTIGPYAIKQGNPQPSGTVQTLTVSNGTTNCAVDFAGISRTVASPANNYQATGRVDFTLSPRDQLFVRYLFNQSFVGNNGPAQFGTIAQGGTGDFLGRDQQIALDWTRNWTTHLVNQARFSYVREASSFPAGSFPNCLPTGLGGNCPPFFRLTSLASVGLGVNLPQAGLTNNSQWQDNASWQHGRHLVKFGGEYDRQRAPNIFLPNADGRYSFLFPTGTAPETVFDAFLQQAPTGSSGVIFANGPLTQPFKEQDADLYLGDDWRIKDNLTINLGIRWEFTQQAFNTLANLTLQRETNPATAIWPTVDPATGLPIPLSLRTLPIIPNRYDHFAPSFGFAWTPHMFESVFGRDKTVIRGGYRMAYDPQFYNIFLNVGTASPFVNLASFACPAPCPYGSTAADVFAGLNPFISTPINPGRRTQTQVSNNFTNPYAEEWTLGVEREISGKISAEVRYVGTHTVHEFQTVDGNPELDGLIGNGFASSIPAGVTPCATPNAPGFASMFANCDFRLFRLRDNGSTASYHSLQSQLKFRTWHGFTGGAAYTFSKNEDNASEIFSTYGPSAVAGPQDPFCTGACERGLSALDYPHNFTVWWNYDLPFGRGQTGVLARLLGGWALAGTYKYTSGQVWTPFEDGGSSGDSPSGLDSCNDNFNNNFFGVSSCRPFMGNPLAPVTAVGLICNGLPASGTFGSPDFVPTECPNGAGGFLPAGSFISLYDPCLSTGATPKECAVSVINPAAAHWIANTYGSDKFFGTPYGNVRRNPGVRGQPVDTVNLNLIKNTRVSERVNLRLEANVYNLFNTQFLGVPCADLTPGECTQFGGFLKNDSGGVNEFSGTGAGLTSTYLYSGLAQRRIVLGAHIIF